MYESALLWGTIYPLGDKLSYDDPVTIVLPNGLRLGLILRVGRFQALVDGPFDDPIALVQLVREHVQGLLDSLGFHLGFGVTAEVEGGRIPPDCVLVMEPHRWPEAVGRGRDDAMRVDGEVLQPMAMASVAEPLIRYALSDVRLALRNAADTAFYAYRACESVRQWFQDLDPATDRSQEGWGRLRSTLDLPEDDLSRLAKMSRDRRHGDDTYISEDERLWAIGIARTVVGRVVDLIEARRAAQQADT